MKPLVTAALIMDLRLFLKILFSAQPEFAMTRITGHMNYAQRKCQHHYPDIKAPSVFLKAEYTVQFGTLESQ